jgi:hypothetical protein
MEPYEDTPVHIVEMAPRQLREHPEALGRVVCGVEVAPSQKRDLGRAAQRTGPECESAGGGERDVRAVYAGADEIPVL